jgi:hypothetical protein
MNGHHDAEERLAQNEGRLRYLLGRAVRFLQSPLTRKHAANIPRPDVTGPRASR